MMWQTHQPTQLNDTCSNTMASLMTHLHRTSLAHCVRNTGLITQVSRRTPTPSRSQVINLTLSITTSI